MAGTFHLLSALPLELRIAIWQAALPDFTGPSVFFYRDKRYWCARRLAENEAGYIPVTGEMGIKFRSDLLDQDNQFYVPPLWVNREAHSVASAWLHERGTRTRLPRPNEQCLFTPPFNGALDALYVSEDRWMQFCLECTNRMGEPDLLNQNLDLSSDLTKVAISDALFMRLDFGADFADVQIWFQYLTVLFVVIGTQPDEAPGSWRWEVQNTTGGVFVWHEENKEFLYQRGDDELFGDEVYERMGEVVNTGFREAMSRRVTADQGLEIRPVSIIRK
ncbi:hypothetical protein NLG97_g5287 [Lecanicillium saksenae]|uniref:Uncharacterized protein n=1 Tax=Lecanicillium saksenae TaxID=468837 RepID=A0ACC1QW25_9HYPO|nr:hypothetical protein NLG97_g5287 [Lecanicillium saksenae]